MVLYIGLLAGLLQACGYAAYIRKSLTQEIEPNASTWFMFSYGTLFLTILEWDRGAAWGLLVLPLVCSALSVYVAFSCWRKGTLKWPEALLDRTAFIIDIGLTITYVSAKVASESNLISEHDREIMVIGFLLCSNLSTVVSFIPLMRNARGNEHPLPWSIWAAAYATLLLATLTRSDAGFELLLYPVLNTILHGSVALVAMGRKRG